MKKFTIYLITFITIFFVFFLNIKKTPIYSKTFLIIDTFFPIFISSTLRMIAENDINSKRIKNDYNEKFLPNTQFNRMDFKKIPLDFIKISDIGYLNIIKRKTFYIDLYNDYLFIMPKDGSLYYTTIKDIDENKKNFETISSNLKVKHVLDLFIKDNKIYVSYVKQNNDCSFLHLASANINLKKLKFEDIFYSNECMQLIQAGRIQKTIINKKPYILLSTQSHSFEKEDERDYKPQDDNSIYGKIIAINEKEKTYKTFSKGHRNVLGLLVDDEVILSTENGPRGGDEINRIYKNGNYGWDIASYGKKYHLDESYGDHHKLGFIEPIFSFIPSIGISEIVKIDNNFDKDWQDNYLVATMFSKHLLRVKFNNTFEKLDFYEKIFIGERIRDLKYFDKKSMILMALEDSGSIGVLKDIDGYSQKRKK
jgi:hypothetical protein